MQADGILTFVAAYTPKKGGVTVPANDPIFMITPLRLSSIEGSTRPVIWKTHTHTHTHTHKQWKTVKNKTRVDYIYSTAQHTCT